MYTSVLDSFPSNLANVQNSRYFPEGHLKVSSLIMTNITLHYITLHESRLVYTNLQYKKVQ